MTTDREKLAVLVKHWIEHNEGHRQSYLEWRDKLEDAGLPRTLAALERIAALTAEANEALAEAAEELGVEAASDNSPAGPHDHDAHGGGHTHEGGTH